MFSQLIKTIEYHQMKLLKLLSPPILFHFFRYLRRRLKQQYIIEDFSLKLSPGHALPDFQAEHRLYDRFLPFLASFINEDQTIIDVGANIGDTAFQIATTFNGKIICIEGSEFYFKYLIANVKRLPSVKQENIQCIHALVSQTNTHGKLSHVNGTARFVENNTETTSIKNQSLDNLLQDVDGIRLIKVDTDGFDHDVLLSGKEIIEQHLPILYWENVVESDQQLSGYRNLYKALNELGYSKVYVFDNFGNLLLSSDTFDSLYSICQYTYTIKSGGDKSTFGYTDTLAVSTKDEEWIDEIIESYKSQVIKIKNVD